MNYLANYYKNLCENLQEQLNHLEAVLAEARKMTKDVRDVNTGKMVPTRQVEVQDWLENDSGYERMPTVWGQYTDNKGKGSQKNRRVSFIPGNSLPGVVRAKEIEDAEELKQNWAEPPGENVFMQGIQIGAAPLDISASKIKEIRERGNNRKGSGKKYQKKLLAQIRAEYEARQRAKQSGPAALHDINTTDGVPVYRNPNQ